MPPLSDEEPAEQSLYDDRLVLDRTKLNILVYEGSTGGDFGLRFTLSRQNTDDPHVPVVDRIAAAFDELPTIGRCQSLAAWAPKVRWPMQAREGTSCNP